MESKDRQPKEPSEPSFEQLSRFADEDLMRHLKAGHNDALAVLFDRYHRLILSVAFRILRDVSEAEDVMQSIFLEIWKAAGQFDASRGTTKVWLLQYAYHRSMNRRQYLSRRGFYDKGQVDDGESNPAETPLETSRPGQLACPEIYSLVHRGLDSLNHPQRRTLKLAHFEGMSLKEIAQYTGESLGNVRHYYYRGLSRLRALLLGGNGRRSGKGPQRAKQEIVGRGAADAEV
jgi:RNA polymerase sigma-70 factor (ECF subfamily)